MLLAGVPHPLLFAALTIAFAMVPFGAWVAFTAATLILLLHGGSLWVATGLFGVCAAVMLISDNLVQPALIGGTTRLPFLLGADRNSRWAEIVRTGRRFPRSGDHGCAPCDLARMDRDSRLRKDQAMQRLLIGCLAVTSWSYPVQAAQYEVIPTTYDHSVANSSYNYQATVFDNINGKVFVCTTTYTELSGKTLTYNCYDHSKEMISTLKPSGDLNTTIQSSNWMGTFAGRRVLANRFKIRRPAVLSRVAGTQLSVPSHQQLRQARLEGRQALLSRPF